MSSLVVDSEGNRIETDILVSGWMRKAERKFKLLIPNVIKKICFEYWLITVCDEWLQEYALNDVIFRGQCVTIGDTWHTDGYGAQRSIYGCEVIESGVYSWKIRFITEIEWICIGIVEDDKQTLQMCASGCNYARQHRGCFILCNEIYFTNNSRDYYDHIADKGTIVTMTLDMDNKSISYKINGKDYGIAYDGLIKKKYRLAITLVDEATEVELI